MNLYCIFLPLCTTSPSFASLSHHTRLLMSVGYHSKVESRRWERSLSKAQDKPLHWVLSPLEHVLSSIVRWSLPAPSGNCLPRICRTPATWSFKALMFYVKVELRTNAFPFSCKYCLISFPKSLRFSCSGLKKRLSCIQNSRCLRWVFTLRRFNQLTQHNLLSPSIWLGCCMRANSMYEISSNQPSLVACPGLMWCATGLRFYYIGDTDPESKLAIGIGHLWSWAGFMAAHIWAINFAINYELHQYSGDNNEPICCPKCSFKLIWPYLVSCYPLMTQFRPLRQPVITL